MAAATDDPFELSAEETQIMLGRYAGATMTDLSRSTGMPPARVAAIVERLTSLGLLGDETPEPPPADPPRAEPPLIALELGDPGPPQAQDDLVALLDGALFDLVPGAPKADPGRRTPASRRVIDSEAEAPPAPPEDAAEAPEADAPEEASEADPAPDTREYKKLYETELHPLPLDERVALAGKASGAKLFALCFDPVPAVIAAMFANTATGIEHARLIAFHHRDARGLDELAGRPAVASDPQVHRRLVRNPATTEPMLRRLLGSKRLLEVYKISNDREVPERSRATARNLLRSKFATAQAEERVELVWSTEGRVLLALTGCTFDSRTTSILCSKNIGSMMLVQSFSRFPATPPALIAHLLRQPVVKRQQHLRNALLQHPNCPSEAKRRT